MAIDARFRELGRDMRRVPMVLSVQTPNQRSRAPTETRWERANGAPPCIATPPPWKHGIACAGVPRRSGTRMVTESSSYPMSCCRGMGSRRDIDREWGDKRVGSRESPQERGGRKEGAAFPCKRKGRSGQALLSRGKGDSPMRQRTTMMEVASALTKHHHKVHWIPERFQEWVQSAERV